jgi:DNA-binding CsgD family transcriptional regulator
MADEPTSLPVDAIGFDANRGWLDSHVVTGALDERWNISELSSDTVELLGPGPAAVIGLPLHEIVVPADRAALLAAIARASCEPAAAVHLHVRQSTGTSMLARATIALSVGDPRSVYFALDGVDGADLEGPRGRVIELERALRRIAAEVHAASIYTASPASGEAVVIPAIAKLSARQWEVVDHLLHGERVSTIASEMFVSESTVRNHLVAIFRKLGVHSQGELVELLRRARSEVGEPASP